MTVLANDMPAAGGLAVVTELAHVGHGAVTLTGPVPASLEEAVEKAAANCPERAIIVS